MHFQNLKKVFHHFQAFVPESHRACQRGWQGLLQPAGPTEQVRSPARGRASPEGKAKPQEEQLLCQPKVRITRVLNSGFKLLTHQVKAFYSSHAV